MGYRHANGQLRPALEAKQVRWVVLAPSDFYKRYVLSQFEQNMNQAICELTRQHQEMIAASFAFDQFPIDNLEFSEEVIRQVVINIGPVKT